MTVTGDRRMSEADRAGLAARSPEGHAAKSIHIRGVITFAVRAETSSLTTPVNLAPLVSYSLEK